MLKEIDKLISNKYNELTLEEKKALYIFYNQNEDQNNDLIEKLKKIIFKIEPPSPEQFLDPREGWLNQSIVASIYPLVKEDFLNILSKENKYKQLSLYGSTRQGKTFLARLLIIYTIIFIHCLREPSLFYNLSPLTDLCIYLISFKFDKTRQLYLKPIYKILEKSERFVKVKYQDKVSIEQEKLGNDKIVWARSATVGEITLSSGLQIMLGNDNPNEIIGADIIQCYISEITFFIDEAGATEAQIYQLYSDSLERIEATVGQDYLTWVFLDSSANHADSLIERHIIEKLRYDKDTYFRWRTRWDIRPYKFPKWFKRYQELKKENLLEDDINIKLFEENLMFKIITGNNSIPAQIITEKDQLIGIPKNLIRYVPIDSKSAFENNLIKSIKDILGCPSSNENKFIQEESLIENIFNVSNLKNIEKMLIAESTQTPESLLWDQIKSKFFTSINDKFYLYRAPHEPRYAGIDSSYSIKGDASGFCILHKEWNKNKNDIIYIIDFCFTFGAIEKEINLESPSYFIMDLIRKGNVAIKIVSMDTFQSQASIQLLDRFQINSVKQSVDDNITVYQFLKYCLTNQILKAGKNIFLKNNLNSLLLLRDKNKEKIDHSKGLTNNAYNGDWVNSTAGINAKDLSDAVARALWEARNDSYIPSTCYEDENDRLLNTVKHANDSINKAFDKIHICY